MGFVWSVSGEVVVRGFKEGAIVCLFENGASPPIKYITVLAAGAVFIYNKNHYKDLK